MSTSTHPHTALGSALRVLVILLLSSATVTIFAEAASGRKISRGQVALDGYLNEATVALQAAQKSREASASKTASAGLSVHLYKNMNAIHAISGTVDDAVLTGNKPSFDSFKETLPSLTLYQTADGKLHLAEVPNSREITYLMVEQDIVLDDLSLRIFHQQAVALKNRTALTQPNLFEYSFTSADGQSAPVQGSLRGMTEGGQIVRWTPGSTLSYCVLKWTFGSNTEQYDSICAKMKEATDAWANVCNIKFSHRREFDNVATNVTFPVDAAGKRQVLFVVANHSKMRAVARAFFPNDSIDDRFLLINPGQFYGGQFNQTGILRHELGHVLGFRHEHISPNAPVWDSSYCSSEPSTDSTAIGDLPYDRHSVMHYPCASVDGNIPAANWAMELTMIDIQGAQIVYGPKGATTLPANPEKFKDFDPKP